MTRPSFRSPIARLLPWLMAMATGSLPFSATAQPSPEDVVETVTRKAITDKLKQVNDSADFSDEQKTQFRNLYERALQLLREAESSAEKTRQFTHEAETADEELARIMRQRAALPLSATVDVEPDEDLPSIRLRLERAESKLSEARNVLSTAQREPDRRAARMKAIPTELAAAAKKLDGVEKQLRATSATDDPLQAAKRMVQLAERQSLQQQISMLEAEKAAYATNVNLLPLRRALAADKVKLAEQQVLELRSRVAQQRLFQIEDQISQAAKQLDNFKQSTNVAKEMVERAASNLALAEERKRIDSLITETSTELASARRDLSELKARRSEIESKVDAVGLSQAIGLLLRNELSSLPNERVLRNRSRTRQATIRDVQHKLLELEQQRRSLDAETTTQELLRRTAQQPTSTNPDQLDATIETLAVAHGEYLDLLIAEYNAYLFELVSLDSTERELSDASLEFEAYIDERILWIRSGPAMGPGNLKSAREAVQWCVSPKNWLAVGRVLIDDVRTHLLLNCAALLLLIGLTGYSVRMRRAVARIGQRAAVPTNYQFHYTAQVFGLTAFYSVTWPAVFAYLGWRLSSGAANAEFARALGSGSVTAARVALLLVFVRQTCRLHGLAGAHFGWTSVDLGLFRKYLRLLLFATFPLVLFAATFEAQSNELWSHSLGRICFVLLMLLFASFAERLLRPKRGLLYRLMNVGSVAWFVQLRHLWYLLGVAAPLALALLAGLGYYLTAVRLAYRLEATLWLIIGLSVVGSLLLRWVLLRRRRLAIQQWRQQRATAQAATAEEQSEAEQPAAAVPETIDLPTVSSQTRQLLLTAVIVFGIVGIWAVWTDVLPALGFLERFELWNKTVVDRASEGASTPVERIVPVTAFDLMVVLLILAMTYVAAKNIPGLLEMSVLQRLPLDSGMRFTIVTITRYVIVITGVVVSCNRFGVAWSKVQWLIAALTVGLGFGLQEIFANFVSGIILLVERPVRVGDLVTIGDINGTVTQIRMRATTVRDWNRRELIVPNKDLVTGQLVNWTLSDSTYRADLSVGIAYGSDTALARDLLLKVAAEHDKVLDKPKPKAIFKRFGDSALEYELRIFIPHMDFWPRVVTEVNMAIDREFRESGIVIAFPQRDIHIRTVEGRLSVDADDIASAAEVRQATQQESSSDEKTSDK